MTPEGSDGIREIQRFSSKPATMFTAMCPHVLLYKENAEGLHCLASQSYMCFWSEAHHWDVGGSDDCIFYKDMTSKKESSSLLILTYPSADVLILIFFILCVCVVKMWACHDTHGDKKIAFKNQFFSSTLWDLGTKLRSLVLCTSASPHWAFCCSSSVPITFLLMSWIPTRTNLRQDKFTLV